MDRGFVFSDKHRFAAPRARALGTYTQLARTKKNRAKRVLTALVKSREGDQSLSFPACSASRPNAPSVPLESIGAPPFIEEIPGAGIFSFFFLLCNNQPHDGDERSLTDAEPCGSSNHVL